MSRFRIVSLLVIGVLLWAFAGAAQESAEQAGPTATLEAEETRLELNRAERRQVQRGLAAAGFDPGPADGLFGRATREAIRQWQASRGEAATGYLDADAAKDLLIAGNTAKRPRTEGQRQHPRRRQRPSPQSKSSPVCWGASYPQWRWMRTAGPTCTMRRF